EPLAILDASAITAIRTAAASAAATDALAKKDAGDLALIGSGTQARTHLEAMGSVRRLRGGRVGGRDPGPAGGFARTAESLGVAIARPRTAPRMQSGARPSFAPRPRRASQSCAEPGSAMARTSTPSGPAFRQPANWTARRFVARASTRTAASRA